jgi:glycosyltransferase involved in cell wall biosynthesis
VYTDDCSTDRTGELVSTYLAAKGMEDKYYKIKINEKKLGMMENIYNTITNDCQTGEIAVMLDGDDSFIGRNVLLFLNAVYQK